MDTIREVVLVLVPMILSLTVHEFFHAQSALWLGDDTAASQGRLTLNPVPHIDPIGTLLLPIMAVVSGSSFFFGWARPVPVNPVRFSRMLGGKRVTMKAGMALTAAAGPLSNLALGFLSAILMKVLSISGFSSPAVSQLLYNLLVINYILAIFNFLPLPPLDGSRVIGLVLPKEADRFVEKLERNPFMSMMILIALLGTGVLGAIVGPVIKGMLQATSWVLGIS